MLRNKELEKKIAHNLTKMPERLAPYIRNSDWILYILISQNKSYTYCGISNRFHQRFRQHIGMIRGGARYTKIRVGATDLNQFPWSPVCIVSGWSSATMVRKIEWRMHKKSPHGGFKDWKSLLLTQYPDLSEPMASNAGITYRLMTLLFQLLSCVTERNNLVVTWFQNRYKHALWDADKCGFQIVDADLSVFDPILEEYRYKMTLPKKENKKKSTKIKSNPY